MVCVKCKTDQAHRSHRRGVLELLSAFVAVYPYRCRDCGHRFLKFRHATVDKTPGTATEREIRTTRSSMAWKRKRREFLMYGAGILLFVVFLYFITRERGGSPEGG